MYTLLFEGWKDTVNAYILISTTNLTAVQAVQLLMNNHPQLVIIDDRNYWKYDVCVDSII